MKIYTTLNRIKSNSPCESGWKKLLSFLNKTEADDEPLDLLTILESNGFEDCLWAFQCTDNKDRIFRLIAADFAESVLHIYEKDYPNDTRPRKAIQAARDYANGLTDEAAMDAAMDAAWDAAMDARDAARAAARAAAWAAARAAAMDAAWKAAMDARDAARAAARAAAWAAARAAAETEKQKQIIIKHLS